MSIGDPLLAKQMTMPDEFDRRRVDPSDRDSDRDSDRPGEQPCDRTTLDSDDAALYERLAPELIRFATALVGPSGAEDLLANAVLNALSSPAWSTIDNKRAYLYRCVVNTAYKQRRATARRLEREARVAPRVGTDPVEVDPTVLAALRRLTVRQRAVVYLTYWSDLTPSQVAHTLDSSLRTVERDLTNARTRLEELLS